MDIDWGTILTAVLTTVLPTLVTIAVSYLAKQWADLKKSEKYGSAMGIIESMAATFIAAADQIGNEAGWDGAARKAYVVEHLNSVMANLPIKFTPEQTEEIIDSILEGVYGGMKVDGLTNYKPKGLGEVETSEPAESSPSEGIKDAVREAAADGGISHEEVAAIEAEIDESSP
jgi:hypothetical protein